MPIRLPRTADYFLTVPAYEVTALTRYLDLMNRNLSALVDQDPLPEWDGRPESSGQTIVAQLHHEVVGTMLPQVFRTSFTLALYATLESAVREAADVLRDQHRGSAPMSEFGNFMDVARTYFEKEFAIQVFVESDPTTERLRVLTRVRNALVHANGRKGAMKIEKWEALKNDLVAEAAFTLDNNCVQLESVFLDHMLAAVRDTLRKLISDSRDSLANAAIGPREIDHPRLNLGGVGD